MMRLGSRYDLFRRQGTPLVVRPKPAIEKNI